MNIDIRQISDRNLRAFIKLPFKLYKQDPLWVPPLISAMLEMLDARNNMFLRNGEHAFFMAYRNKVPVARVLAGYNAPVSEKTGVSNGYFSLFEAEDKESGLAVLEAAEKYLKQLKVARIVGPYSPTNGEEDRALLIEGFDSPPVLYASYNPEWYTEIFESFGMRKDADLLAFKVETETMPLDRFRTVVGYAKKKFHFEAYPIKLSDLDNELKDIQRILLESDIYEWDAWIPSWDFIVQSAENLKAIAEPELVHIVRRDDGRPLAFVVCVPNYNEVLIHLKGRLFPFGFLKYLYWKKRIKSLRVMMQFCVKDYERTAAVSSAYLGIMEAMVKKGYTWADASTIGEENIKSWRAVVGAGGKLYRRFRWYVKELK